MKITSSRTAFANVDHNHEDEECDKNENNDGNDARDDDRQLDAALLLDAGCLLCTIVKLRSLQLL